MFVEILLRYETFHQFLTLILLELWLKQLILSLSNTRMYSKTVAIPVNTTLQLKASKLDALSSLSIGLTNSIAIEGIGMSLDSLDDKEDEEIDG